MTMTTARRRRMLLLLWWYGMLLSFGGGKVHVAATASPSPPSHRQERRHSWIPSRQLLSQRLQQRLQQQQARQEANDEEEVRSHGILNVQARAQQQQEEERFLSASSQQQQQPHRRSSQSFSLSSLWTILCKHLLTSSSSSSSPSSSSSSVASSSTTSGSSNTNHKDITEEQTCDDSYSSSSSSISIPPWTSLALSGLRMGLVLYLANVVWKTVQEVLEEISMENEYYNQQQPSFGVGADDEIDLLSALTSTTQPTAAAFTKEQIADALAFVAQRRQHITSSTSSISSSSLTDLNGAPPMPTTPAAATAPSSPHRRPLSQPPTPIPSLVQLVEKLNAAGLELYPTNDRNNNDHDDDSIDDDLDDRPSVQSVLRSLTRPEVSILTQSLWTPPPSSRRSHSTTKNPKNHPAWNKIAGLDHVKQGLLSALDMAVYNNNNRHNQASSKRRKTSPYAHLFEDDAYSPVGILLYGHPGCGKTCLVRTLAQAAQLPCLVVTPSLLMRKFVGETNLACRSLMSLVQKLSPCILCMDEVDGLFRERSSTEHESSRELKTEFLQHLDGMMSRDSIHLHDNDSSSSTRRGSGDEQGRRRHYGPRNLLICATNRPFDCDSALLRRLTLSYQVPLPDVVHRCQILRNMLSTEDHVDDDTTQGVNIEQVALHTKGYSPSDLRHLLQTAVMTVMREEEEEENGHDNHDHYHRPLTTFDILRARQSVPATPLSQQYQSAMAQFASSRKTSRNSMTSSSSSSSSWDSNRAVDGLDDYDDYDDYDYYESLQQQQQRQPDSSKWETEWGNFYSLGSLQVDPETFDLLTQLAREYNDEDDSYDEDNDDDDDDEDSLEEWFSSEERDRYNDDDAFEDLD